MKYLLLIAAATMMYVAIPQQEASAQGWNQRAYNNAQAAQKSQQHYNNMTRRR